MRNVLVAHRHEVMEHDQPVSITTTDCRTESKGGAFVRVSGIAYEVTTMALLPPSAAIILAAVDANHPELMHLIGRSTQCPECGVDDAIILGSNDIQCRPCGNRFTYAQPRPE